MPYQDMRQIQPFLDSNTNDIYFLPENKLTREEFKNFRLKIINYVKRGLSKKKINSHESKTVGETGIVWIDPEGIDLNKVKSLFAKPIIISEKPEKMLFTKAESRQPYQDLARKNEIYFLPENGETLKAVYSSIKNQVIKVRKLENEYLPTSEIKMGRVSVIADPAKLEVFKSFFVKEVIETSSIQNEISNVIVDLDENGNNGEKESELVFPAAAYRQPYQDLRQVNEIYFLPNEKESIGSVRRHIQKFLILRNVEKDFTIFEEANAEKKGKMTIIAKDGEQLEKLKGLFIPFVVERETSFSNDPKKKKIKRRLEGSVLAEPEQMAQKKQRQEDQPQEEQQPAEQISNYLQYQPGNVNLSERNFYLEQGWRGSNDIGLEAENVNENDELQRIEEWLRTEAIPPTLD